MPAIPAPGKMRQEGQSEAGLCYMSRPYLFTKKENREAQHTFLNNTEETLPALHKLPEEHTRENTYRLTPEDVSI